MKRRVLLFLTVAGGALLLAAGITRHPPYGQLFACDIGDPMVQVIAGWPREQYLLVYFQRDDGSVSTAAQPLTQVLKRYGRRANVKLVPSRVATGSVEETPAVLISSRGEVLACFDEAPGADEVGAIFESPGRTALVAALKKYDSVFLCLVDPKSPEGKKTVKVVKGALKLARDLTPFSTHLLVVDPNKPEEEYLARNLHAQIRRPGGGSGQPVVALVCATGRVADVTLGVPTVEQIIDRLQRIYREGGFTDPSRFGEDLLLVW